MLLQAESLWLHLPIITELASMCHRVFAGGSIQYAYTTIPTYPRYTVVSAAQDSVAVGISVQRARCLTFDVM